MDTDSVERTKGAAPPYTSFPSLKTLVKGLKEHGVPSRIDRSVLTNFSGAVGGQLLTALKFLYLTDTDGHPTDQLKALAETYDTDRWTAALEQILRNAYAPLFQINLETASPSQFNETYRRAYPGSDEVQRKSITFFLSAAKDAQIKVSAYIMKNKKPRATNGKRKAQKTSTNSANSNKAQEDPKYNDPDKETKNSHNNPPNKHEKKRNLPVLIEALVESLPEDGQTWSLEEASEWLQTAAYNFRYAYKLGKVLKVEITSG